MKLLFLFLLISCISLWKSKAQENSAAFERVGLKEGLPMLNVAPVLQDRNGYLWFTTHEGLIRYDGYDIKTFTYDRLDSTSLSDNIIVQMHEDREGIIWIGTSGNGLSKFNPHTQTFTRYVKQVQLPQGLHSKQVSAINEDKQGRLWLGTSEGLTLFDQTKGTFTRHLLNPADSTTLNTYITYIMRDQEGTLWIGTYTGLFRMNNIVGKAGQNQTVSFTHFKHQAGNPHSLSSDQVMALCEDKQGNIWIGTLNGLNRMDKEKGTFTQYLHDPKNPNSLSSNRINRKAMTVDLSGNLWIGTDAGLIQFNAESHWFTLYSHDPANEKSLSSNLVRRLLIDRSGTLWIGTLNGGVNKLDPHRRSITHYRHEPGNTSSLSHNTVRAIWEDKQGQVWIGTEGGGLNRLDPTTGTFAHYRADSTNPHALPSNYIGALCEDRNGNLWIAGAEGYNKGGGISMLERKTGRFKYVLPDTARFTFFSFYFDIYEDKQGILWFGAVNGLRSYDPKRKQWAHHSHDPTNPNSLSDYFALCIEEDKLGNLWIGTGDGLNKLNRKTGQFVHFRHDPKNVNVSIAHNTIECIYQDSKQDLWIGTGGGGLCKLDPATETFITYSQQDGLPSNIIYSILEDDEGYLWLGTQNGLCRFSPATKTATTFDYTDGLQGNQFASGQTSSGASFKGQDGTLYFGGHNGFNALHPRKLTFNSYVPPIVITQVKLFDKLLIGKNTSREFTLDYDQNFLSFEFAALNYTNSRKNQYAYQLEGVDRDWVYSGNRRLASYTNLPPGEYTFRVKGSNNDGVWNEQAASLRIIIRPPFYRTTLAYVGYALLFVAGLLMARKAIINRERLHADLRVQQVESEKLRELDSMKSRFFANLSHEFRTPLSIINGIVQKWSRRNSISEEQQSDFGMIGRNASRLLQLINQLLDLSRLEAGELSPHLQPADITSQLRATAASFESLAQSKNITYHYALPLQPIWALTDADKIEKIFTNLLSNAIKFTSSGGQVAISAVLEEAAGKTELKLAVQDTGKGISLEHLTHIFERFYQVDSSATSEYEGTGIGLSLVKELTELLGGNIHVESKPGQGTTFKITLPLQLTQMPEIPQSSQQALPETKAITHTDSQNTLDSTPSITDISVRSNQKPHLLIVEDNPDLRIFMKDCLSKEFAILEASNGQAGLDQALETIPDLIISDVMMPGIDGFTLCEKLKTDERTSHIPVILLTAKADTVSKLTGLTQGADDYLIKPFEPQELLVRIKNLIDGRKQLRQLFNRQFSQQSGNVTTSSPEEKFLQKAATIIEASLANADFDVETFSREMGMSGSQLRRKLNALTSQSPSDFIRLIRLQKALILLQSRQGNVSEVALMVGFSSLNYFTRCFREHFGKTPTDFIRDSHDLKVKS